MIHFTVAGGRVRFFIDEAAAAERGLSISSRLLALALGVRQRRS
jgi:YfiR/HmsC-like